MPAEYRNPVLGADWSDPDVITVGDDHYLTASTFNRVPGLPVLHSRDLVRWSIIGHALTELVPADHFRVPRHGGGVWAPALRFHDDRFWILYPDPDHGIFMTSATDPAGPWTPPHLLYAGRGLIDPCPLWDDDGEAYLVHGWAKSRAGIKNLLTVHRMAPDCSRLLGPGQTVIDGAKIPGFGTLEGPKLYKRDGWFWIFAPAGGVATGWQSVFRSRSVWGPYEERTTLAQGSSPVNGPHQGAWVQDSAGDDWFLHFQDTGPYGRVVHLQPMSWSADGWPQMGTNADGSLGTDPGEPVLVHRTPSAAPSRSICPDRGLPVTGGDTWDGPALAPHWYWQANPDPSWTALPGDGTLRLTTVANDPSNLRELANVLAQRLPLGASTAQVHLRLDGAQGTRAGLVLLGLRYTWIGLVLRPDGATEIVCATGGKGRSETVHASATLGAHDAGAVLRVDVDASATARFSWRPGPGPNEGGAWTTIAIPFEVSVGAWTGADVGLFATSPLGTASPGLAVAGPFTLSAGEAPLETA